MHKNEILHQYRLSFGQNRKIEEFAKIITFV